LVPHVVTSAKGRIMKYPPALATVLLLAAACSDEPQKGATPTAPRAPLSSVSGAPSSLRASTVCAAYARDRALAKASLDELPEKASTEKEAVLGARLERKLESLDALITDACR
jgi:hypothetical protein